jgi:hypothetical protein
MADELKPQGEIQNPPSGGSPASVTPPAEEAKGAEGGASFQELQTSMKELREKYVDTVNTNKKLVEEVESLKGTSKVVERIQKALGGDDQNTPAQQKAKADFYRLLVDDPGAAIRQVYKAERDKELAIQREKETDIEFNRFTKLFPEYKTYEEDMKAELIQNPAWFGKPDFLKRVFFDILSVKDPALLTKLLSENRGGRSTEGGEFIYEGVSQTLHGGEVDTADSIMARMKAVKPEKSIFE